MVKLKNEKQTKRLDNFSYVLGIILSTISAFIVMCSAYLFIQFLIKPNTPPKLFGLTPQIVLTNDMSGNKVGHIESGDFIFIETVPIETVELQTVVAYIDNGNVLVSRVTGINTSEDVKLLIRADNDETSLLINDSQMLGKIKLRIAGIGGFIYFTQSLVGIILFIGLPALVLVTIAICEAINRKKNKTKTQKELKDNLAQKPPQQEPTDEQESTNDESSEILPTNDIPPETLPATDELETNSTKTSDNVQQTLTETDIAEPQTETTFTETPTATDESQPTSTAKKQKKSMAKKKAE